MRRSLARGAALLCGAVGVACSLTSLDPYFECPAGNRTCKDAALSGGGSLGGAGTEAGSGGATPAGAAGGSPNAGGNADAGALGVAGGTPLGGNGDPCDVDADCAPGTGTCYFQMCGPALQVDYLKIVDPDTRWIKFSITITNRTTKTIDLSTLTVRYYFTPESAVMPELQPLSAGDPLDLNDVIGTLGDVTPGDSIGTYMEIGFKPGAGTLTGGQLSSLIRLGIHGKDFMGTFVQSGDYSYEQPAHVTLYRDGQLVSGTEPTFPM